MKKLSALNRILIPAALLSAAGLAGCQPGDSAGDEESITPDVAVQVARVVRTNLQSTITAYGVVAPAPAQAGKPGGGAQLATPAAGVVFAIPASEGQRVQAGDIIVRLDDRPALAAVDKARHAVAYAEQVVARQEKLKAVDGTSEKAIQDAQQQLAAAKADLASAQAALAFVQLSSPIDGVVSRIRVQPGQAVDANTIVAEIVDPDRLVADVTVPASEATAIKAGQEVRLFVGNNKQGPTGSVRFVSPSVDPATGQTLVRIDLPKDSGLRTGQLVGARIVTEEHSGSLAVPREAVYTDHEGHSTVAVVDNNIARLREVTVGLKDSNWIEIAGDGIGEGTTVVTVGSYALPDGSKVHVTREKAQE